MGVRRCATTHGPRGSFGVQRTRSDFSKLTSPLRAWCQADETPSWRVRATAVGSHPQQLPRLSRDWSESASLRPSDARSGGGGALLAGSLPWLRIANSKPQPPDLVSRCSHSGVNDCLGALWTEAGLGGPVAASARPPTTEAGPGGPVAASARPPTTEAGLGGPVAASARPPTTVVFELRDS